MALVFKKAQKEQVRIKISIAGPAGSGKTMSSLLIAYGLIKAEHPEWTEEMVWDHIVVADSENGSASLYVGTRVGATTIGAYNVIDLTPPFTAQVYMDAIHIAEEHDMSVIIIDSLSHVWSGEGGLLDEQGKIAARTNNSYTSWRTISPQYTKLVDAILQSPCHVITAVRAKMDYQQIKGDNGKTQVKAVGMGMVLRDGYEYETTVALMLDADHVASAIKDRTGLFDGQYFTVTADTGKKLYQWLSSGAKPAPKIADNPVPAPIPAPAAPDEQVAKAMGLIDALAMKLASTPESKAAVGAVVEATVGTKNYKTVTDIDQLRALYKALQNMEKENN